MERMQRDQYYIELAKTSALRSTCDRARVGAIAVKDNRVLCTGYNGSPARVAHCDAQGHTLVNNHCVATVHAEMNIICTAAKEGVSLKGAAIYTTHEPCFECIKHCINAGIEKIVYLNPKEDDRIEMIKGLRQMLKVMKYV